MKKYVKLIPLFESYISENNRGKRRKRNGERISKKSIQKYIYTLKLLKDFENDKNFELRICTNTKLTAREFTSEKNY